MRNRLLGYAAYAVLFNLAAFGCFFAGFLTNHPLRWGASGFAFVIGTSIGSFLTLATHRIPRGMNLNDPPSSCPRCGEPIRMRHNIPVIGWIALRGRCADCGLPIPARYPLLEFSAGLLAGAGVWAVMAVNGY